MTEEKKNEMKEEKVAQDKAVAEEEKATKAVEQEVAVIDSSESEHTKGKKDSRWSKFTSNKWYLGLAAVALLATGGVAGVGATSALVFTHQSEAVGLMDEVRSEFGDWEDRFDRDDQDDRNDDADDQAERQAFSQLTTKVDFKAAMDTALKEAGSGFVTSIHLEQENGKAVYEVETFDGTTEKDYTIDADSGSVLRSQTDSHLDAEDKNQPQPQKSASDILTASQDKYSNAKISDISLEKERSGKWIYEVDFLDGDTMKTAYFEADTGNFISDETDRD